MFKNFFNKLFSLKGRYSKLEYLIYGIISPFIMIFIFGLFSGIFGLKNSAQSIVMALAMMIAFVFAIIAVIKRVRALNGNIFFNLLMFILFLPFYIIYLFSVTTHEDSITRNTKQDFFDFVKFIIPILIFIAIGYYNQDGAKFKNLFASKNSIESKCEDKEMQNIAKQLIAQKLTQMQVGDEITSNISVYNSKKAFYDTQNKIVNCSATVETKDIKTNFVYTIQLKDVSDEGTNRLYINIPNESINKIYSNLNISTLQKPSCSSDDTKQLVMQVINNNIGSNPVLKEMTKSSKFKFSKVVDVNSARAVNYNETTNLVECKANIKMDDNEMQIAYTVQIPQEEPDKFYVEVTQESLKGIYQSMFMGNFLNLNKEQQ